MTKHDFILIIGCVTFIVIVFVCGVDFGTRKVRDSAIQAGVAEYKLIDPKTRELKFEWIKSIKESTNGSR